MALYWTFDTTTAPHSTRSFTDLNHAKAAGAAEYCDFIRDIDPDAKPIVEWRPIPGPAQVFQLYADNEPTTWTIYATNMTISLPQVQEGQQ